MTNLNYIRVASDLHLEQFSGSNVDFLAQRFLPLDPRDAESVLALAGDISSKPSQLVAFLEALKGRFLRIYFVPGNHELYKHDFHKWEKEMEERLMENLEVVFPGHGVIEGDFNGVNFFCCTLWADGGRSLMEEMVVENCLNDFHLISYGSRKFKIGDMAYYNREQRNILREFLSASSGAKKVVITHHLPSYSLCHPRFGSEIDGGFASNCEDIILDCKPDIWIHGHTHDTQDVTIGDTRIVCNPAGYRGEYDSPYNQYQPLFISLE